MSSHNPLDLFLGYQLRRASTAMGIHLRGLLKPYGLTPTLSCIMLLIESNSCITQSDLSKILSIKRANMVAAISSLEKMDYVRREAIDGRSQKLILTEKGIEVAASANRAKLENEAYFKSMINQETADSMITSLPALWES